MSEAALSVGDKAPDFSLEADSGQTVSLSSLRGKRFVLYFYPKDNTPGCTKEACDFRDSLQQMAKTDTLVFGVSTDDIASHQRFARKFSLNFPLLSDPDAKASRTFGVYKQKSMYGKTFEGIERTTFVIDGEGRIQYIFPKVKVDGHIQAVLQMLASSKAAAAAKR